MFSLKSAAWALLLSTILLASTQGQQLPSHSPLRILIVSDEVNPHGLPPGDLTQPGEISAALVALPNLNTVGPDPILEVATDNLEDATAALQVPSGDPDAYDVLVYFAHRVPNGGDGQVRQEAFVQAVDDFLVGGGGVVSFHHGIYRTNGKESMQDLLGAEATGSVPWNTVDGQNVIAIAPGHFITRYGVDYPSTISYEDPALGVPLDTYPMFNNTPDERYPNLQLLSSAGSIEPLFASDYDGSPHLLGYVESRPEWAGVVVMYQPGEYQPHALESGPNFQILLNSIQYAAGGGNLLFANGFESGDLSGW